MLRYTGCPSPSSAMVNCVVATTAHGRNSPKADSRGPPAASTTGVAPRGADAIKDIPREAAEEVRAQMLIGWTGCCSH
jgi:hypothetical protein